MSSKKNSTHLAGRSAVSGRFVPLAQTYSKPATTVRERVPNPGHGDTGRKK